MPSRWRSSAASVPSAGRAARRRRESASSQPFADLDGGGLAGAVGAQQAEALARAHLEIEAVHRDDVAIGLAESAHTHRELGSVTWAYVQYRPSRRGFAIDVSSILQVEVCP